MNKSNYKIAVVTNNGTTVSQHFGSAPFYEVFTVENGQVVAHEKRDKYNAHSPSMRHQQHHQFGGIKSIGSGNQGGMNFASGPRGQGMRHGEEHHSMHKHNEMIQNISDCDYLIARGMGNGIYCHLENANIKPIITDIRNIEGAVKAVIDGTIVNHYEMLH